MLLDLVIVLAYFSIVFIIAIRGRQGKDISIEEYFLSSRNLRWPSIAISTIATNVQGYQFLGMMGSAYLYGLAQANLEINAMQGILLAAFVFVPLYLKNKVITITQFIKQRLGKTVALSYSIANIALLSTVGLGAALFWGAYAADLVFGEFLTFLSDNRTTRISIMIVGLGLFSAIYTYFGGLAAVVKTDIIQFAILTAGGIIITVVSLNEVGGFGALYEKAPDLMHLHLPSDHPQLPWIAIFGMFLLNINYWCANQSVIQRSLAARSLKEAQIGLMVGGVMKYFMTILIIVPGIALAVILDGEGLVDPDETFPYLVKNFLPLGLRGLILCALFASLMSTVDSLFNSISTLWSIDIYKAYLNKKAKDKQVVKVGRNSIVFTLISGIVMGLILLYVKFDNPEAAFTHTLNNLRYYINCGIVVIICLAAFLVAPNHKPTIVSFAITIPLHLLIISVFPEMNYFVRAMWVILVAFGISAIPASFGKGWFAIKDIFQTSSNNIKQLGWGLAGSLALLHIIFH